MNTKKYPKMNKEQQALCVQYMPLVYKEAKIVYNKIGRFIEYDVLCSAGFEGLVKCAIKFKPELGFKFITYALQYVHGYMYSYINRHGYLVRPNTKNVERKIRENKISPEQGEKEKVIPEIIHIENTDNIIDNELRRIKDTLEVDYLPEGIVSSNEMKKLISIALSTVTEKERYIIIERYVNEKTLEEIGADIGLTRERIRQIKNKTEQKLKIVLKELI